MTVTHNKSAVGLADILNVKIVNPYGKPQSLKVTPKPKVLNLKPKLIALP